MAIVKKWAGCVMSFIAGVLGLALSATSGMKVTSPLGSDTTKAFKVITDSELMDQAKLYKIKSDFVVLKVFAIITLIVSVLLLVYSVIALLQNLNVIKSSNIGYDVAGWVIVALFLIATIGLMIASNGYANAMYDVVKLFGITKVSIGVYQPIMLVVSIITAIVTATFSFLKRKSA